MNESRNREGVVELVVERERRGPDRFSSVLSYLVDRGRLGGVEVGMEGKDDNGGRLKRVLDFAGRFFGFDRRGGEERALRRFMKRDGVGEEVEEVLKRAVEEMNPEEQADFLGGGMESMGPVVEVLSDVAMRNESPIEAIVEAMKFSREEMAAVRAFGEAGEKARDRWWEAVSELWALQGDYERIRNLKELVRVGDYSEEKLKEGEEDDIGVGWFGKTLAKIRGRIRAGVKVFTPASDIAREAVGRDLPLLRNQAIMMAGPEELVEMRRKGIISGSEFRKCFNALSDEQKSKINFSEKLVEDGDEGFQRASVREQVSFLEEFYRTRVKRGAEIVAERQEEFLKFDLRNLLGEDKDRDEWLARVLAGASVPVNLAAFHKIAVKLASAGSHVGQVPLFLVKGGINEGKWAVASMKEWLARSALKNLAEVAGIRGVLEAKLGSMIKEGRQDEEKEEFREMIAALRGLEGGSFAIVVLRAARLADLMESVGVRGAISGVEEQVGLRSGKHLSAVMEELEGRLRSLRGKDVMRKYDDQVKESEERKGLSVGGERIRKLAEEMGIPEEYWTQEGMERRMSESGWGRVAEGIRKVVAGETKVTDRLPDFLTRGSRRVSVEEVVEKYGASLGQAMTVQEMLMEQVRNGQLDSRGFVELATAVTLGDVREALVEVDLKQVKERSRLDRFWEVIAKTGSVAAVLGVVSVGSHMLGPVMGRWAEQLKVSLGHASVQLKHMQEALQQISQIAEKADMTMAQAGGGVDVWLQRMKVHSLGENMRVAEALAQVLPKVSLISQMSELLPGIVVSLGGSWMAVRRLGMTVGNMLSARSRSEVK